MLTQINLLPWRELKREQNKKRFIKQLIFIVLISVLTVLLMRHVTACLLRNQIIRNQLLQKEIVRCGSQIKEIKDLLRMKKILISRISLVQQLQSMRILTLHLFDELSKVTPVGIYLTKIEGNNNIILVNGYAQSNTSVSEIMKNIEQDAWLQQPVLNEIKKIENGSLAVTNEFKLTFMLGAASDVSD